MTASSSFTTLRTIASMMFSRFIGFPLFRFNMLLETLKSFVRRLDNILFQPYRFGYVGDLMRLPVWVCERKERRPPEPTATRANDSPYQYFSREGGTVPLNLTRGLSLGSQGYAG